jgi:uncharacterized protein YqeY
MSLKEQLQADLASAMRTHDDQRRDLLRMVMAAIKQVEVDERATLDDAGVQDVIRKQIKQRRESIADLEKAGRADAIATEEADIAILEGYLPQMMSRDEVEQVARAVISELGVSDVKAMGQVMAKLMPQLKGRADGRMVNEVVRTLLT